MLEDLKNIRVFKLKKKVKEQSQMSNQQNIQKKTQNPEYFINNIYKNYDDPSHKEFLRTKSQFKVLGDLQNLKDLHKEKLKPLFKQSVLSLMKNPFREKVQKQLDQTDQTYFEEMKQEEQKRIDQELQEQQAIKDQELKELEIQREIQLQKDFKRQQLLQMELSKRDSQFLEQTIDLQESQQEQQLLYKFDQSEIQDTNNSIISKKHEKWQRQWGTFIILKIQIIQVYFKIMINIKINEKLFKILKI